MIVTEGIEHAPDLGMTGQEVGDLGGAVAMGAHPQLQRLQAFQMQPGIEGAEAGAGVAQELLQIFVQEILVAEDGAAQGAALAVDEFGGGMDHDMRPQLHRPL